MIDFKKIRTISVRGWGLGMMGLIVGLPGVVHAGIAPPALSPLSVTGGQKDTVMETRLYPNRLLRVTRSSQVTWDDQVTWNEVCRRGRSIERSGHLGQVDNFGKAVTKTYARFIKVRGSGRSTEDLAAGMCPGMWITIGPKAVFRERPSTKSKKLYETKISREYRIITVEDNWVAVVDDTGLIGWMHGVDIFALEPIGGESGDLAGTRRSTVRVIPRDPSEAPKSYRDLSAARKSSGGKKGFEARLDVNAGFFLKSQTFTSSAENYEFKPPLAAPVYIFRGTVMKNFSKYGFGIDLEYYKTMLGKLRRSDLSGQTDFGWEATASNLRVLAVYKLTPKFNLAAHAGYRYDSFTIDDPNNIVGLPSEKLSGITAGASVLASRLWNKFSMRVGLDVLLSSTLDQTEQLSDGTGTNINAQHVYVMAHYKWKSKIEFMMGYNYWLEGIEFQGASTRNPSSSGEGGTRNDTRQLISAGLNYRF